MQASRATAAAASAPPGVAPDQGGFDRFLLEVPLLAGLDAAGLAEVQRLLRPFDVQAGGVLFRQGDASDGLYLIKEGEIAIMRRVPGDETVRLAVLGRCAIIGEMGLLDHGVRSASAVAVTASTGYFVSRERFEMMRADMRPPAFAVMDRFITQVAARTRKAIELAAAHLAPGCAATAAATAVSVAWTRCSSPATLDQRLLLALPFFGSLGSGELRELMGQVKRHDFARGDLVWPAGAAASHCLIVVRGALATYFSTPPRPQLFSVHGPGSFAGELPLLDGGPHPLIALAREPTIALSLDRERFEVLRKGGGELAFTLFAALGSAVAGNLRRADGHLARVMPQQQRGDVLLAPVKS